MEIFKRKDFARWQAAHRLSDEVLCKAVDEMCRGLVDASLEGELFKKRVPAHGAASEAVIEHFSPPVLVIDVFCCMALPKVTRRISPWKNRKRCDSRAKSFWIYRR